MCSIGEISALAKLSNLKIFIHTDTLLEVDNAARLSVVIFCCRALSRQFC